MQKKKKTRAHILTEQNKNNVNKMNGNCFHEQQKKNKKKHGKYI